uniref:Uncharacterized protein n=1 Tax=Pyxicephalus adspersus TaxID=30357 RepID=A0AAV3AHJ6_PYXAD|nr:TPA: hypothetical protein GDO54_010355 [Pyxicephalus adspersus]
MFSRLTPYGAMLWGNNSGTNHIYFYLHHIKSMGPEEKQNIGHQPPPIILWKTDELWRRGMSLLEEKTTADIWLLGSVASIGSISIRSS